MQQPNFMSRGTGPPVPPATPSDGGHGPPITKKQRGGQTPVSIRQQRPSSRGRDRGRIPPPTTTGLGSGGGPPGGAGDVAMSAALDEGISRRRAELRRLQEKSIRQRQAMHNRSSPREESTSSTAPPFSTTAISQPPVPPVPIRPAVAPLRHTSDLFPSVPKSPSVKKDTVIEEDSQIAAFANASTFNKDNNHDGKKTTAEAEGGVGPPSMSMPSTGTGIPAFQTTTTKSVNPNPNLPPPTPTVAGSIFSPTPATVGRRLEFPSSIKPPSASSPKKDPSPVLSAASGPTLPPIRGGSGSRSGSGAPPPPSIRRTTQGPPTPVRTASKATTTTTTTTAQSSRRYRSRSKSPAPTSKASTTSTTTAAAAAPDSVFEMRRRMNRAKSAPPARPPLPSGPPPPPPQQGSSSSPAATAWAKKKVKARSKARSRSSGRVTNRPKPVIVSPGSLHLEGPKETTTKDAATVTATSATKKFASGIPPPSRSPIKELLNNKSNDNTNNVVGGNTGIGMGVMDTSKTSAPILTTTSTSTTPTTFLQSNQKSMYDNDEEEDGQKTPPSTGSSARRQKLQLMREQAGALGALATAVDVIGVGPLATAAFANAAAASLPVVTAAFAAAATEAVSNGSSSISSSGPPATAAFAAAISGATTTNNNIASGPPPKTLTATTTATAGLPPPGNKLSDALPPPGRVAGTTSSDAAADVPPTTGTGSLRNEAQARLEEVYAKSEREKTAAFLKVKELELQLTTKINEQFDRAVQQKQQRHAPVAHVGADAAAAVADGFNLEELVHLAETQGPDAALQWVKQQQQFVDISSPKAGNMGVGFTSPPTNTTTMTPTSTRRRITSRALTPHPTRQKKDKRDGNNPTTTADNETPEEVERRLIQHFREAVQYVPHEFSTEVANFTVRRPYGMDGPGRPEPGHEHEQANHNNSVQLFEFVTPPEEPFEAYARRAHVSSKASIEVVAVVKADNSPFLLFNAAGVRYKTNPYSQDEPFVHIENVDLDVDRPLGHITYRDAQTGREREYSLDEILEEALIVRENYCGTLTSIALRLEENGQVQQQQQQHPVQEVQIPGRDLDLQKAPSKDVGVETDEQGMMGPDGTSSPPEQQEPAAAEDDDAGSSDVLVVFIGMMFSAFFKIAVGLVVGLPLRVVRSIVVWTISYLLIQYVLLYCANATGYHEWILAVNNDPVNPFQFHLTIDDFLAHTNRPGIM